MSPQKLPDPLALELRSPDYRQRVAALARLAREPQTLSAEAVEALTENLASDKKAVLRHAVGAIAAIGARDPAIVARLIELLDAPAAPARWASAYALGLVDGALDLRAREPLLEALSNPDGDIRWAALELLVRLGRQYPAAIRHSLLALQAQPDPNSRKMSLYVLRDLGFNDPEVLQAIRDASANPDSHVRLAALSVLKGLAGAAPESVDIALARLKSDSNEGVRRAAASTLGWLKDRSERVLTALCEAANAPHDDSLRKAARQTLTKLEEER